MRKPFFFTNYEMKLTRRRKYLLEQINNRKQCFNELIRFIRLNKGVNEKYQVDRLTRSTSGIKNHFERLIFVIQECMKSSANPRLAQIGSTIEKIYCTFQNLSNTQPSDEVPFTDIIEELTGKNINTLNSLHCAMKNLDGIGDKISALIVRNLHYANSHNMLQLTNWPNDHKGLKLAVDIVICETMNRMLELENAEYRFEPSKDFEFLNDIFRKQLKKNEDLLLFEDLWFWGYFNQQIVDKVRMHNNINLDKIYAEQWFRPDELFCTLIEKSKEYRKIVNFCDAQSSRRLTVR